jgi:hypothetical protein
MALPVAVTLPSYLSKEIYSFLLIPGTQPVHLMTSRKSWALGCSRRGIAVCVALQWAFQGDFFLVRFRLWR